MYKKRVPAVAAALALGLSAVAVPQAFATQNQEEASAQETASSPDVTLAPEGSKKVYVGTLFGYIGKTDPGSHHAIESVTFSQNDDPIDWLNYEFNFDEGTRDLKAESTAPKGTHEVTATITYTEQEAVSGEFSLLIEGEATAVTGTAKQVTAGGGAQDTGISIANRTHGIDPTVVTATDKNNNELDVSFGTPSEGKEAIVVNPGAEAVSPITLTISDDEFKDSITKTIPVVPTPIKTTLAGRAGTVEATDQAQETGLTVTNRVEGKAEITAVDEDGQSVKVTFGKADEDGTETILATPGENVDGPIMLAFDHPALDEPWVYRITVEGHSENSDDNDFEPIVVSGTPGTVKPTDEAQDTGLRIENQTEDTVITATDEDEAELDITVEDGKILVTPGAEVDGPIQLVVSDDTMATPTEFTIEVEGHEAGRDDNEAEPTTPPTPGEPNDEEPGSSLSSSDDAGSSAEDGGINWGVVGIVGVIAAVIGVIAAIGGGFLPML